MALSKTGRFLTEAEVLGVGSFPFFQLHTPPNLGGEGSPPKHFGGEPSKSTCFTVFFSDIHPRFGGVKSSPPEIWGVWGFQGGFDISLAALRTR